MIVAMKNRLQSMNYGFLVMCSTKSDKIAKKAMAKKRAAPKKKKAVKEEDDEMDDFIDEDNDGDSDEFVCSYLLIGREVAFEDEKPKKRAPRKRAAPKVKKEKIKKEESESSTFEDEEP